MTPKEFGETLFCLIRETARLGVPPEVHLHALFTATLASADVYAGRSVTDAEWAEFCREMFARLRAKGASFEKVVYS